MDHLRSSTLLLSHTNTKRHVFLLCHCAWHQPSCDPAGSRLYECIYSIRLPISHCMNVAFCLQLGARVILKSVLMTRWSALSIVEWTDRWKKLRTARSPARAPLSAALITLRCVNAGDDASLMSCFGRRADVLMHTNRSKRTRQQALIPFWRQYLISGAWLFQRWSSLIGC